MSHYDLSRHAQSWRRRFQSSGKLHADPPADFPAAGDVLREISTVLAVLLGISLVVNFALFELGVG